MEGTAIFGQRRCWTRSKSGIIARDGKSEVRRAVLRHLGLPAEALRARGPLSLERLSLRDDGRLAWRMKRPAPDGSTHLLLTPLQLVRKLAALVPPPRRLVSLDGVASESPE
ncbi:MAG: transposase [Myxococcaceae bacterium]